jgi:hypothetical protein
VTGWTSHLAPAGIADGPEPLGIRLRAFLRWQAERWPRLAAALEALERIETRVIQLGSRPVTLQWNPGRVASTTARVDELSLRARPCFLCPGNLPAEEFGLPLGDELVLLANPAPIMPLHIVAAHRGHTPQRLAPVLGDAIALAAAAAGQLTVFYNGPRCGASAPDHIHLQAVAAGLLPDERRMADGPGAPAGRQLSRAGDLEVWSERGSSRVLTVLRGSTAGVARGVRAALAALDEAVGGREEPPVNLLLTARGEQVTALLYPRGAHRPGCYAAEGADRCLISPGALDMAGLVITVRRRDYDGVDGDRLAQIFAETSLAPAGTGSYERILERRLADG